MKCDFDYCVYNRVFFCILKETQLDSLGMCNDCIIVSIPDDILEILKEKQLKDIEKR